MTHPTMTSRLSRIRAAMPYVFGGARSSAIDEGDVLDTIIEVLASQAVLGSVDVADMLNSTNMDLILIRGRCLGDAFIGYAEAEVPCAALRRGVSAWTLLPPDRWAAAVERYSWIGRAAKIIGSTSEEHRAIVHAAVRDGIESAALDAEMVREQMIAGLPCIPPGAHNEVAARVNEHLRELLDTQQPGHEFDAIALDELYIDVLRRLGDEPRKWAKKLRDERARQVARAGTEAYGWLPGIIGGVAPPRRLTMLAKGVWSRLEAERKRPTALPRSVWRDRLMPAMTRQTRIEILDTGNAPTLLAGETPLADIDVAKWPHSIESLQRSVDQLATPTGNRLLKHLILRATEAWCRGDHDHSHVTIAGGLSGLAEAIGADTHDTDLIHRLLSIGCAVQWRTPDVIYGGLWTYAVRQPRRNVPGELRIRLGEPLDPGYANRMAVDAVRRGDTTALRMARRLVPELRFEPPMGGARQRDHAPIWALHRLAILELVDHAEELAKHGAVVIRPDRWQELAETARLPASILDRTMAAWVAGESEKAPALLAREGDEYTLATPHGLERDFIVAGGRLRSAGRQRARKRTGRRGL